MTIKLIHSNASPVCPDGLLQEKHLEVRRLVRRLQAAETPQERAELQRRLDGCYEEIELIEKSMPASPSGIGSQPYALAL